jgi:hypothetical protein
VVPAVTQESSRTAYEYEDPVLDWNLRGENCSADDPLNTIGQNPPPLVVKVPYRIL